MDSCLEGSNECDHKKHTKDFTDFFWDFCLNTNHDSNLLNGNDLDLSAELRV